MAEKTYEVVGNHAVHGHAPGSKFAAALDAWSEKHLIESGHLRVVETKPLKETDNEE